jgi:alpha-2-macroglobulin
MKLFLSLLVFLYTSLLLAQNVNIADFSPTGIVKEVQQVKVSFSHSIVSFGSPRVSTEIFDVDCPVKGKGRWLDDKIYVYEFANKLEAGLVCRFVLKDSLVSATGKKISGKKSFQFSTGGPSIKRVSPYEGSTIEEDQIFSLFTDTAVDESSLVGNVFFNVEGIKSKVDIVVLSLKEADIQKIIDTNFKNTNNKNQYFIKSKLKFPTNKKIELVWGKGVKSKTGVENQEDQILSYSVREPFLVSYHCERENQNSGCIPFLPITLNFSSAVPLEFIENIILEGGGQRFQAEVSESDKKVGNPLTFVSFNGPFAENTKYQIQIPETLRDEAGRSLGKGKTKLNLSTGSFPPLAKFSGKFGIIEAGKDALLPVTLRNLEPKLKARLVSLYPENSETFKKVSGKMKKLTSAEVWYWLKKVNQSEREKSVFPVPNLGTPLSIPRPNGPKSFEVVGVPLKSKGLYVVELESSNLGKSFLENNKNMYVSTLALVTNLAVHFKNGKENSMVWVTSLDSGEPVKEANVTIRDCKNKILFEGKTNPIGIVYVPKSMSSLYCSYTSYDSGLLVTAEKEDDFSFVHSDWTNGIESWRFNLPYGENYASPNIIHTVLDRPLFRAGESVSMKHFIRKHFYKGIQFSKDTPKRLLIVHEGSGGEFSMPLTWKKNGTSESTWKIPGEAKLGAYNVYLEIGNNRYSSAEFRVEEFRLPILQGSLKGPPESLVNPKAIDVHAMVKYFSGGGASNLPIRFKYWFSDLNYRAVSEYEEYSFFQEELKEGKFPTQYDEEYDADMDDLESLVVDLENTVPKKEIKGIQVQNVQLDNSGTARLTIPGLSTLSKDQKVNIEMEYKDPNGEIQTIYSNIPVYSSAFKLGIKEEGWILNEKEVKVSTIVLNLKNKPVSNQKVEIEAYTRNYFSHRRRLVGGFYAYENYYQIEKIGNFCSGITDDQGLFTCAKPSPASGNIILQAKIPGEKISVTKEVYVVGANEYGFYGPTDSDRMDILPEKRFYEPGEKAKIQVRMPYKEAQALVTIEREGVLEASLRKITSEDPVISLDIKDHHAPNVFISVLAVRGRVAQPKPTALIDLARPSFKLGIVPIKVGWKAHQLKVSVSSDKETYMVREKAKIKIKVQTEKGTKLPKGTEIAIAAVDESLLDLSDNKSWDILSAMMKFRSHEVNTSTAQMQVVGRRHFGLKALPQGGGGGSERTRELFDTLLYWNPSILVNESGEAEVTIPLGDSYSSFRIVAVANGGAHLFGHGYTNIRSSQDLMLFSGVPLLAREGDELVAELSVRNTTDKTLSTQVELKVKGGQGSYPNRNIDLLPGQTQVLGWKVEIPQDTKNLEYEFTARSSKATDKIKVKQKIIPAIPVSIQQATMTQLNPSYQLELERPQDAVDNRGGVQLIFSNSLVSSLSGVKEYMNRYPYSCLEQQVSRFIATKDNASWAKLMSKLSLYLDSDGFAKYFPDSRYGDPVLTSYLLAISHERNWNLPEEQQGFMLGALEAFLSGKVVRYGILQTADFNIKKLIVLEALSRYGRASAEDFQSIPVVVNLLPTSAILDYWNVLFRVKDIPDRDKLLRKTEQILKSRMNLQGTQLKFSSEREDKLYWLMISADYNSVKLITSLLEHKKWTSDMGKIVKGAVLRQSKGTWDLTLANAWGTIALEKFAKQFEKDKVNGETRANLKETNAIHDWKSKPKGGDLILPWKQGKLDLNIQHKGEGKPWVIVQSKASVQIKEQISNGYNIEKTLTAIERKDQNRWSVGDVIRIKLRIKSQIDMTWVVVNDPIPTGASILTGGLRKSESLTQGEQASLYSSFEERAFDAYRVYYEYTPEGEWNLEYTIRLNQEGRFTLPQTRVEAMYSPDVYGEFPGQVFEIGK